MKQEFNESGHHRLVAENGVTTHWATYRQYTYLYGRVGVTDYYTGCDEKILTPHEFLELTGVGKDE